MSEPYFVLLREEEQFIEVKSKNTKHCWMVFHKRSESAMPITLYHKHNESDKYYHKHYETRNVGQAVRSIKGHDEYVIKNRG